ncbi:NACHT, LRR and PYD domains-containing protein 12-like isoform X2 [Mastacembelus armatus]|uniref:NACHT, LRR and PYD domains-containing protein 12-like isoform X2 n=1 Tax=Mastacembelus armatus TaxID=205130 RepID=UPI000E45BAE3|nr:NACHT, LRR and PYD domains-containing protein 12-like isoform X2 [Mastacembelus armatus]
MESPSGPTVVPDTSQDAAAQREAPNITVTAQNESVIIAPQFTSTHVTRDVNITVNNTYGQVPSRTHEADAVAPKTKENIQRCQTKLKSYLQIKTQNLFQGTKEAGSSISLNKIYTELYITQGGSGDVNGEHEVVELECQRRTSQERKIDLNDIVKPLAEEESRPQRVLTKGIAGIGKTVAVQKFTHDWATGAANQNIQFIFPFTFRDLNSIKDEPRSLKDLITDNFEEVNDLERSDYNSSSVLFIFDGLDESKFPLDFENNKGCRNITQTATVDALLTNLIQGNLLHKASIWITTRPAAASKIPVEFNRVTEVRGFNDEQKEEYSQKKFGDKAQKIISHLQSKLFRSLYIMCHIPMFCWIVATVLESLLANTQENKLPRTVTEMYMHFLIIQTQRKREKRYQKEETDKDLIMKLGKLAFEQLQKGNLIFSKEDLQDCKIDLEQAAVYSGVCTQVIRKEHGLYRQDCYSFIHLTVQEFLAALYVLETFTESRDNLLASSRGVRVQTKAKRSVVSLHESAVDLTLNSYQGRWDLFLRFLFGLSQDKNQELLQKIGFTPSQSQSNMETISYIHKKIKKLLYTDKSINLFYCLNELGDQSLVEQVQKYQSSGDVSKISPSHWSALAFVLLVSDENLDVFDLKDYDRSDAVLERLVPVLKAAKTALLNGCHLTDRCCEYVSSVLSSKSSGLEELDLSRNELQDSIKPLCDGLRSPNCKLQTLRLRDCQLSERSCEDLASALSSQSSSLKDLDLSNNDLQDSGVKLLFSGLRSPHCRLETLRLSGCKITGEGCAALTSALGSICSSLKLLDLSYNHRVESGLKPLSAALVGPHCNLGTLRLIGCELSERSCKDLASALSSQSSSLKDLDLSNNDLLDSGVKFLSEGLMSPHCRLEALRLSGCQVTGEGCAALASALRSNPSHLRELDLSYNHPGDSGEELLFAAQADPHCNLETLRLDHGGEQRLKPGQRKWVCKVKLDPDTAHTNLKLSDNNRKVTEVKQKQPYPDHPDRFDHWKQLLCRDGLTGRCYWEVEWKGKVNIALTYRGIIKGGRSFNSRFGQTEESWTLSCSDDGYSVCHNKKTTGLSTPSASRRVAVYLDYPAGTVTFYRVSLDTLTHLHTFNTTFTEPVYPGFWLLSSSSSVFLCSLVFKCSSQY